MYPAGTRAALFVLLVAALAGCGPDTSAAQAVPIAQYRAGLTMAAAGGCDTSIAAGLSAQLVEELNCVAPNLLVDFSGPHVTLYSAVQPYLAPAAAQDLRATTTAANDSMTISSAYRTLGQQYLLYKWWQAGQCGIQVAAVPGSSNHQSGRALDTPYHSAWRSQLEAHGWTWLGSSDVVHFDHFGSPNVASNSILAFQRLWNRNHATGRLAEDGDWGPNTEAAMAQAPVTGFAVHGCATTGKVAGTVTHQGTGAPLEGVSVTAGGQAATTGTAGTFEFTLPAGVVTVTASKAGFTSAAVQRTVTVGATVSASLALAAAGTDATLSGRVVEQASPATGVAGALVQAGGQRTTTDASGAFLLRLPAGTVTLLVSKPGFAVHSEAVTLAASATQTVQVALFGSSGNEAPLLLVESPLTGGTSPLARLTLVGTAVDDSGPVASVALSLNGAAAVSVPVVAGRFEAPLQLGPGPNAVVLSASDGTRTGSFTWTGTFRAGFSGLVHRFDDRASTVVDAELTLVDPDTRALLGVARSGPDGRFELAAAAAGTAILTVLKPGYTQRDLLVTVSPEERTVVDVGMTPGDLAELRFLEPASEGPFEVEALTVSGVVTGFEVAAVTVNGVPATLVGAGFVAKVPLPEGRTVLEAIAEGSGGQTVRASMTVLRPLGTVSGGCAAAPGGAGLAVAAWALARRRRRSVRAG